MITLKHLKIYKKYGGDGDAFVRSCTKKEKYLMTFDDWKLIEEFIQGLIIIRNNSASSTFSNNLYNKIEQNCDSQETINDLKDLLIKFG